MTRCVNLAQYIYSCVHVLYIHEMVTFNGRLCNYFTMFLCALDHEMLLIVSQSDPHKFY